MEVCVDNIQSVIHATRGGARRLELCSSLRMGGLTPTVGFMMVARKVVPKDCKLFVMIRPRGGSDYHYNQHELNIMIEDVKIFKEKGADGFVFGCLDENYHIDETTCDILVKEAHPLDCTFHRAFDVVKNPFDSLVLIDKLGFKRVLTSGQEKTAELGKDKIKEMVQWCTRKELSLKIMPGGGIDEYNVAEIVSHTGVLEFHGSAKSKHIVDPDIVITDENTVKEMVRIGNTLLCSQN